MSVPFLDRLFSSLERLDDLLWDCIGFPAILIVGLMFGWKTRFVQVRKFPRVCQIFLHYLLRGGQASVPGKGVHPIAAFFAGLGGCVGIGNIVAITMAVQIGGPGALLWVWVAAALGSLIKYSEVFLGMRYRIVDPSGGYSGGPMYFLRHAFSPGISSLFCVLMCLYGVEFFQFNVVVAHVSANFAWNKLLVTIGLLILVICAERGGIKRVAAISSTLIPLFIAMYLGMGAYVLWKLGAHLPAILSDIVHSAFTPRAAVGAFAGSTFIMTVSQGVRRGAYSSDIGVGYSSIIHSASRVQKPTHQAALVIFEVFIDTFVICTLSVLLVLLTGTWRQNLDAMYLVQHALGEFFPYMEYFMPFFLFLLGYSTIIAFFCAGIKTAEFLHPQYGRAVYYSYATIMLFIFSFVDTTYAYIMMSIVQACLLAVNLSGIVRLRKEIDFDFAA